MRGIWRVRPFRAGMRQPLSPISNLFGIYVRRWPAWWRRLWPRRGRRIANANDEVGSRAALGQDLCTIRRPYTLNQVNAAPSGRIYRAIYPQMSTTVAFLPQDDFSARTLIAIPQNPHRSSSQRRTDSARKRKLVVVPYQFSIGVFSRLSITSISTGALRRSNCSPNFFSPSRAASRSAL